MRAIKRLAVGLAGCGETDHIDSIVPGKTGVKVQGAGIRKSCLWTKTDCSAPSKTQSATGFRQPQPLHPIAHRGRALRATGDSLLLCRRVDLSKRIPRIALASSRAGGLLVSRDRSQELLRSTARPLPSCPCSRRMSPKCRIVCASRLPLPPCEAAQPPRHNASARSAPYPRPRNRSQSGQ